MSNKKIENNSFDNITTSCVVVVMLFLAVACGGHRFQQTDAITDRAAIPKLRASEITTVISDSGITRYRISTPEWNAYDWATTPYWEFPQGIHLEKFDENLTVDANIHSRYAKYLTNEQLWELRDSVRMTNIKGELFESERVFWNERTARIYSDTIVHITQEKRIINALGFESNQQMTKYTFRETTGVFPFKDE
ncbi:MAG: LPS export ABC transporter periplasmic protein LptC [Paludibacter sp.]|jgi:LPS export ABC transporter protein LptC|nr:LPS export ABC transporter periplasmic protein LptC [Paludibacter sp.]